MKIIYAQSLDIETANNILPCPVHQFVLQIDDHQAYALDMVKEISDNSWIANMNIIAKASYEACVQRTATELVNTFKLQSINSKLSKEFGEFMISMSAIACLVEKLSHQKIPLAELWKEKLTGNPGFDFHTEAPANILAFGEAKYRTNTNAYGVAAKQVVEFIEMKKDFGDCIHLQNFVIDAVNRLVGERIRSFTLAFSMESEEYSTIFENALQNKDIQTIAKNSQELYLVGVKHV